jgi:hypothetical protein
MGLPPVTSAEFLIDYLAMRNFGKKWVSRRNI